MSGAVNEAISQLNGQLTLALGGAADDAIRLGTLLAESPLPTRALAVQFRLSPSLLQNVSTYHADLIQGLTSRLRTQVTSQIQLGILSGKQLPEVAREIGLSGIKPIGPFKTAEARAEAIARTETNRISNLATDERLVAAKEQVPGLLKEWVAAHDIRTRDSHREAHGQRVPVEGHFTLGEFKAKHPLDPALPAEESVHCRCRIIAVVPE